MPGFEQSRVKCRLRLAMESRSLPAIIDAFAPDADFRSPLTGRLVFKGSEQIGALSAVILDVFEDFRYTDELVAGETGFLAWNARIDGQDIQGIDLMRLDPDGKIREFTVFFRPLPAAAAALRALGAGLGRRRSAARAAMMSVLARPLGVMTGLGDGIGVRLIKSCL